MAEWALRSSTGMETAGAPVSSNSFATPPRLSSACPTFLQYFLTFNNFFHIFYPLRPNSSQLIRLKVSFPSTLPLCLSYSDSFFLFLRKPSLISKLIYNLRMETILRFNRALSVAFQRRRRTSARPSAPTATSA